MEHEKLLVEHCDIIDAKAGDLVISGDKVLHGSQLNKTSESRPVVHGGILHKDALLHYYQLNSTTKELKIYEVPFDFYFANEFDSPDLDKKYILKNRHIFAFNPIKEEDIHRFYQEKSYNNDYGTNQ